MKFSTTPFLFLALVAFWISAAEASRRCGDLTTAEAGSIYVWLVLMTAWGGATAGLALSGAYHSTTFFRVLPGFWVSLIPLALSVTLLAIWPAFRAALWGIAARTSPRAFILVQALRIAAIGGVYKAFHHALPTSFVYPVGIPDLLFGLSALALTFPRGNSGYSRRTLIIWNIMGLAVIMPAPLLMQMGLPGPLYTFTTSPDARALFEFPMVLAPTLVVPLFIFTNAAHATVLWLETKYSAARRNQTCAGMAEQLA